jgi:hypothetical protein
MREERIGGASPTLQRRQLRQTNPMCRLRIRDWGQTSGGVADHAKQTQFPAGPNGTRGDRAKQTQFGAARLSSGGQLCETKPDLGRMRNLGDGASRGLIVRNKANFGRAPGNGRGRLGPPRAKCAKRTQFAAEPGGLDLGDEGHRCDHAKQSQSFDCRFGIADWIQSCAGTPSLRFPASRPRGRLCETNPFGPACAGPDPRWAKDAKQTQFPATPGGTRAEGRRGVGAIVRNKPNLGGRPGPQRAKCAKRTQVRGVGRRVEYPPFHYSVIPPFQFDADCATSPRCPASGNKANHRQSLPRAQRGDADATSAPEAHRRLRLSSYLRGSCLYWVVTGNRRTAMERDQL